MFELIYRGLSAQVQSRSIDLNNWYRGLYTRIVVTLALIGLGALILNATGHQSINIALIIPMVLVIAYIGFQPLYLAGIVAAAKLTGFKPVAALGTWKKFCVHAALFASLFLLTLGIVPVKENPGGAILIIGALTVLGLLSWAFTLDAKWYKKYAIGIVVLAITIGAVSLMSPAQRRNVIGFDPFRSFSVTPQQDIAQRLLDADQERRNEARARELATKKDQPLNDAERAELRAIASGSGPMIRQGKTIITGDVAVYTLTAVTNPQPLCGFESGQIYVYSLADGEKVRVRYKNDRSLSESNLNGRTVETNGESLPFAGMDKGWALTLNGTLPGDKATAGEDGCFIVALNLTPTIAGAYEIDGGKHIVKIRLHAGPLAALRNW